MKKIKSWQVVVIIAAGCLYVFSSNYFLPVENEESSSTFDHGSAIELLDQCGLLEKGMHIDSLASTLYAHNRKSVASTGEGKKVIFWVSDGDSGVYFPTGPACVVEVDLAGYVVSWSVESFEK